MIGAALPSSACRTQPLGNIRGKPDSTLAEAAEFYAAAEKLMEQADAAAASAKDVLEIS